MPIEQVKPKLLIAVGDAMLGNLLKMQVVQQCRVPKGQVISVENINEGRTLLSLHPQTLRAVIVGSLAGNGPDLVREAKSVEITPIFYSPSSSDVSAAAAEGCRAFLMPTDSAFMLRTLLDILS